MSQRSHLFVLALAGTMVYYQLVGPTATRGLSAASLLVFLLAHTLDVLFGSSNFRNAKKLGIVGFSLFLTLGFLFWASGQDKSGLLWEYGRSLLYTLPCYFLAIMPIHHPVTTESLEPEFQRL